MARGTGKGRDKDPPVVSLGRGKDGKKMKIKNAARAEDLLLKYRSGLGEK